MLQNLLAKLNSGQKIDLGRIEVKSELAATTVCTVDETQTVSGWLVCRQFELSPCQMEVWAVIYQNHFIQNDMYILM